jgi:D-serine deaminase-like pyridoxal phosphate-dependent protein
VRPEFGLALSLLCTCLSSRRDDHAVLDVGVKGVGAEFGPPVVKDRPDLKVAKFRSEEHTLLDVSGAPLSVGAKVELIPSHACTTCNLHRELVVHQGGRVVDVWAIEASGRYV